MIRKRIAIILTAVFMTICVGEMSTKVNAADFLSETEFTSGELSKSVDEEVIFEDNSASENVEYGQKELESEESSDADVEKQITDGNEEVIEVDNGESLESGQSIGGNALATATYINTNVFYSDNLVNRSDEKWYKFNISKAGNISITFKHQYIEFSGKYWRISIYNSEMKELAYYGYEGNVVSKTTEKFGIPAGTYYLKIYSDYYSDTLYDFMVNYSESSQWESEVNDTYLQADNIGLNSTYNGGLQYRDDVDWYKFNIANAGTVSLTFKHTYIEFGGVYWRISLYDDEMKELAYYSYEGNAVSRTTEKFGVPSGTYYLKIYKDYDSETPYSIRVNYNESSRWETEINDTYTQADTINVNNTYSGSLQSKNDVDWYKFEVSKTSNVNFSFTHNYINHTGIFWRVTIYNANNMNELQNYAYTGDKKSCTNKFKISKGTYYVKVVKDYYSDIPYTFSVGIKISPISISKTKITIGNCIYTGKTVQPNVSLKYGNEILQKGIDYTVSYSKATKAESIITVKIIGKGKYTGTVSKKVKIKSKSIEKVLIKGIPSYKIYTGKVICPTFTVYDGKTKLKQNRDYIVSYSQNKKVGTAVITITGKGNYSGTVKKYFEIKK